LIEIHLYTHASTSDHSFRKKYRSAVYTFSKKQSDEAIDIIKVLQKDFDKPIITKVLPYVDFKLNKEEQLNYLYTRKNNAFCTTYIHPKLTLLMQMFASKMNVKKLNELNFSN
jgi:peptide-methionine (S)-S-oxide reductase